MLIKGAKCVMRIHPQNRDTQHVEQVLICHHCNGRRKLSTCHTARHVDGLHLHEVCSFCKSLTKLSNCFQKSHVDGKAAIFTCSEELCKFCRTLEKHPSCRIKSHVGGCRVKVYKPVHLPALNTTIASSPRHGNNGHLESRPCRFTRDQHSHTTNNTSSTILGDGLRNDRRNVESLDKSQSFAHMGINGSSIDEESKWRRSGDNIAAPSRVVGLTNESNTVNHLRDPNTALNRQTTVNPRIRRPMTEVVPPLPPPLPPKPPAATQSDCTVLPPAVEAALAVAAKYRNLNASFTSTRVQPPPPPPPAALGVTTDGHGNPSTGGWSFAAALQKAKESDPDGVLGLNNKTIPDLTIPGPPPALTTAVASARPPLSLMMDTEPEEDPLEAKQRTEAEEIDRIFQRVSGGVGASPRSAVLSIAIPTLTTAATASAPITSPTSGLARSLSSDSLGLGPAVTSNKWGRSVAKFEQVKHCVATSNGSSAANRLTGGDNGGALKSAIKPQFQSFSSGGTSRSTTAFMPTVAAEDAFTVHAKLRVAAINKAVRDAANAKLLNGGQRKQRGLINIVRTDSSSTRTADGGPLWPTQTSAGKRVHSDVVGNASGATAADGVTDDDRDDTGSDHSGLSRSRSGCAVDDSNHERPAKRRKKCVSWVDIERQQPLARRHEYAAEKAVPNNGSMPVTVV